MSIEHTKEEYRKYAAQPQASFDVNPVIWNDTGFSLLLVRRIPNEEEGGKWSLPGGRVFVGETIEDALKRIAKKKAGVDISLNTEELKEDLIGVYDTPDRDKRSHVLGLAFECVMIGGDLKVGGNSSEVGWFTEGDLLSMSPDKFAFDHKQICEDAIKHVQQSFF
jgi:ADP-ribose pyrophosphatase YjhB (NUDIX family)